MVLSSMRWGGQRESNNVEDRRGIGPGGVAVGGGGIVLILLVSYFTGINPMVLLNLVETGQQVTMSRSDDSPEGTKAPSDELGKFASVVLADTEETWHALLPKMGLRYEEPRLVLFSGAVRSACGFGSAAVGPFYCPMDSKVYLDLAFFKQLDQQLGVPGDFAQAYVIAHEVGHHVQNLLGIADRVHRQQRNTSSAEANALSVRLELQADCFAGVWGFHAKRERNLIEPGDFEEGLHAASAIGDDQLQQMSQGTVQPESWTHGSSAQRVSWLRRGMETGDPTACDTFEASRL